MTIKKKLAAIFAAAGSFALIAASTPFVMDAAAKSTYGDAFIYTQEEPMKYKTSYSVPSISEDKGLLLYAYGSGARAEFKGGFSGAFETEAAVLSEEGKTGDLTDYSLIFTDKQTGKSFSVCVNVGRNGTSVSVQVNGERGGIVYYSDGNPYGYTALYNKEGQYTEFENGGTTKLRFDPVTKQIKAATNGGAYRLVWDLSQEINDGKRLSHELSAFNEYTVDVQFDNVKSNGKGQLLVYTFGDYKLGTQYVESKPNIFVQLTAKAIVGEEYTAPTASVSDLIAGTLDSKDVTLTVYNERGEKMNADGAYTFVPERAGDYFLYYTYGEGDTFASAYYLVEALAADEVHAEFTYDEGWTDGLTVGRYTNVYIPSATVTSEISYGGGAETATVTVKKDGEAVENYENVSGGFEYLFDEVGEYEIVYGVPSLGERVRESYFVTVSDSVVGVQLAEIEQIKALDDSLEITPAKFFFDGKEEIADVSLLYPSGRVQEGREFVLDELGVYTVEHKWSGGTTEQSFTVMELYSNMFTEGSGNAVSYQELTANNTVTGQMFTLTNNTQVVYDKVIDLSDNTFDDTISDRTQNAPLVEWIVQPNEIGKADMTALYVTFTDVYDPENYISVRVKYMDYNPEITLLRTRATGQNWLAYHYEFMTGDVLIHNATSHEDGGLVSSANFTQEITSRELVKNSMKIYYDDDAKSIYAQSWQTRSGDGTKEVPFLLRDYSTQDKYLSGGDKPWRGWTTGEVRMTMYAVGVSSTANVMLMTLDGEDLSKQYIPDNAAPIVSVSGVDENVLPNAEVNRPYKIFDFSARDLYSEVVKEETSVYFGEQNVAIVDGAFTPNQIGVYTVVYKAYDAYGNAAEKWLEVTAVDDTSAPEVVLLEQMKDRAVIGEKVYLPEFYGVGGVGGITTAVEVTCGGERVPIEFGAFVCEKEGTYAVKFTATDYIGNEGKQILRIRNVAVGEQPVFDENSLVFPVTLIDGDPFEFPTYVAKSSTGVGEYEDVAAKIEVTDGAGTRTLDSNIYTPVYSDEVQNATIRMIFAKDGKETAVERTLPIKKIENRVSQYLTQFYDYNNGDVSATSEGIFFTAQENADMRFSFVRKISTEHLYFRLNPKADAREYEEIVITLRDSVHANEVVELTVVYDNGEYFASVHGGDKRGFDVDDDGKMKITYDRDTHQLLDTYNRLMATIKTYVNGSEFEGFSSGYVYLDVAVKGVRGAASVGISSIANQDMNNGRQDSKPPIISIQGYLSGSFAPGTRIVIPAATTYDVLSNIKEVTVCVRFEGAIVMDEVSATQEHTYVLGEEYGEYEIEYFAQDVNGKKMSLSRYVVAYDDQKPTLTFNGEVAETAKVGSTISLPSYSVQDNGDLSKVKVEIYCLSSDGLINDVKGSSVRFTRKGKHTIYYHIQDENGNVTFYAFNVVVE